jgi:putative spermidine/putrescine transport system permease protein
MNGRLTGISAIVSYGATGLACIFIALPLAVLVAMSFSDTDYIVFPPQGFTLRWYGAVLQDPEFLHPLAYSGLLALGATVGALGFGTPAAFAIARYRFPGREVMRSLLLSPLIVPVLVTGIAMLRMFTMMRSTDAGMQLLIAHIVITLPYVVRTVTASLELADTSIEEAARTLGASRWRTFRRITVPQIAPGLAAGALFGFIISFDNYPISMWLADSRHLPLPITLYNFIARMFDPSLAAISTLMILLAAMLVIVMEKMMGLRKAMGI